MQINIVKLKEKFYLLLLAHICTYFIKQGSSEHKLGFPKIYKTILDTKEREFSEDSRATLKNYMQECISTIDDSYP